MLKTKGKIILTLLLSLIFGVMLVTMVSALEGESITVQFYNQNGNAVDKTINSNGIVEGEITLLGGQSVKLPTKNVTAGSSFNWRTEDGRAWEGGSTVTFYEDVTLFPITAIDISTPEEMHTYMPKGSTVRLLNDIYLAEKPGFPWPGTCTILMNGKTLELNSSLGTAWGGQRAGTFFYGSGNIKYNGTGTFMNMNGHGWGGDCCRLFVGSGITIDAPNAILTHDSDGSYVPGYPYVQIYGIVNCKVVMNLGNAGNRNPRIEIYDGAQLNVNGQLIKHSTAGNTVHVTVLGGTITNTGGNFFADGTAVFSIEGGVFNFSSNDDVTSLTQLVDVAYYRVIDIQDSNGKAYKAVVPLSTECGNHTYTFHSTYEASCSSCQKDNFYCQGCMDSFQVSIGSKGEHKYSTTPSGHKDPTKTSVGWDKYICSECSSVNLTYLYYDPTNDNVDIVVNTGSGEKTVSVKIKDVYILDANHAVLGVKAFGDYKATDIVGIYIPLGLTKVNITTANSNASVKKITLGAGLIAEVTTLKGLTALEGIVIENVADVLFRSNCAPTSLKSIKSNISGANVEFAESAFTGLSSLTELTFSTNSSYTFGKQSFKDTGMKSIEFVDGCSVTFAGEQAFYGSKVEYLYVGKGITSLDKKPFDCAYYLQKIILMDVTSLSDYGFCCMNKGASVPVIYHHAKTLSIATNNTFYQSHGIIIYTKAEITQGFNGCSSTTKGGVNYPAYTIHYGITHSYKRIEKDATCTAEGSVKYVVDDCPCGISDGTSHKVFKAVLTNSSTYTIEDFTDKIKEKLPHDLDSLGSIKYTNGFTRMGFYTYKCSMCRQSIDEDKASCPPLLICYGYSVSDSDGLGSISVKYIIDEEALEQYERANGTTVEYGTVVASKNALNGQTPLDDSGNARAGVYKLKTSANGYTANSIKLTKLNDANKKISYIMSLYIKEGNTISYVQDTETINNPSGVSYKEIKELADYYESLSMTTLSTEAKEN